LKQPENMKKSLRPTQPFGPPFLSLAGTVSAVSTAAAIGFVLAALIATPGCGGGAGRSFFPSGTTDTTGVSGTGTPSTRGVGGATFTVNWPAPSSSRLIPSASNSIVVRVSKTDGATLAEQRMERPASGGPTTARFADLPAGEVIARVAAYPSADGTGTAQASASASVTIEGGQTAALSLTLDSTIDRLDVTPSPLALTVGQTVSLVVTAKNLAGEIVLTDPGKITFRATNSGVPGAFPGRVDSTGTATGFLPGTMNIVVTETESGKSTTVPVSVSAALPAPAVNLSFRPGVAYPALGAGEVVAGDIDGDGNADVAVGSRDSTLLFYGRGDGTLGPSSTISTSSRNLSPAFIGDMNNDGRRDLVLRDNPDRVSVLFNTGSRTFSAPASTTVGTQPTMIAVADFDGDGDRDFAATIPGSGPGGSVTIVKNNGNGTFTRTDSYSVPGIAIGITTGDSNGDGMTDLVVTFTTSTIGQSGFLLFLGDGAGRFIRGNRYNTGTLNVISPVVADYNRDNRVDIAVTNYFDNAVSVLWGTGSATFGNLVNYPAAPYPHIMRTADFDNDSWPDLVTANAGTNNFSILRNLGTGLFANQSLFDSGGRNTRTCDVADFNNDGRPDAVFGNESSDTITILINSSL
jgi:hypothetical protein